MACISFNKNDADHIKLVSLWIDSAIGSVKAPYSGESIKEISKAIMSKIVPDEHYTLDSIDEIVDIRTRIKDIVVDSNVFTSSELRIFNSDLDARFQQLIRSRNLSSPSVSVNSGVTRDNKINFNNVYSNVQLVKDYFSSRLRTEFMNRGSVNFEKGEIILLDSVLNNNYIELIEQTYDDLLNFINHNRNINNLEVLDKNEYKLYNEDDGSLNIVNLNHALNHADSFIEKINVDSLNDYYKTRDTKEYSRINLDGHLAYVLLKDNNFDRMIKETVGNMVEIDESYFSIPNKTDKKYSLSNRTNLIKTFRTNEFADSIDEMSSRQRNTIESIPLIDFKTGKVIENSFINVNAYINIGNKIKSKEVIDAYIKNKGIELGDVKTMRMDPTTYTKTILDSIVNDTSLGNTIFKPHELNTIKSIHYMLYDSNNKNSLYNITNRTMNNSDFVQSYNFLNSMSAMFDRSMSSDYVQYSVNDHDQIIVTSISKDNYNTKKIKFENDLNIGVKDMFIKDRSDIINKYNIELVDSATGSVSFILPLKDGDVKLIYNKSGDNKKDTLFIPHSDNPKIKNISDLEIIPESKLESQYFYGDSVLELTAGQELYKGIIDFVSDVTSIDFLSESRVRQLNSIQYGLPKGETMINSLARIGASAAHKMLIYNDYYNLDEASRPDTVVEYAMKLDYYKYRMRGNYRATKKLYFNTANDSLVIPETKDFNFTDAYASAEEIVDGTSFKPYVVNAENNKLPNNRISHLAGLLDHVLLTTVDDTKPLKNNIFYKNRDLVKKNIVKTDINIRGYVKPIKKATKSELMYASFVYNFYGALKGYSDRRSDDLTIVDSNATNSTLMIQPLVVSDKKHFIDLLIDSNQKITLKNGESFDLRTGTIDNIKTAIKETVGDYYIELNKTINNDYINIFEGVDINKYMANTLNEYRDVVNTLNLFNADEFINSSIVSESEGVTRYTLDPKFAEVIKKDILDPNLIELDYVDSGAVITINNDSYVTIDKFIELINEYKNNANTNLTRVENIANNTISFFKLSRDEISNIVYNFINDINNTVSDIEVDEIFNDVLSKLNSKYENTIIKDKIVNAISELRNNFDIDSFVKTADNILDSFNNYANLEYYDLVLQSFNESDFIELANINNVDIVSNLHYNKHKGKLRTNNSLIYNSSLFNNNYEFDRFFNNELRKYLLDLIENDIKLNVISDKGEKVLPLEWALSNYADTEAVDLESNKWYNSELGRIILAKDKEGNPILTAEDIKNIHEVNPIIERYIYTNYLISKNYRTLMMGTELAYSPGRNTNFTPTLEDIETETSAQDLAQSKRSVIFPGPIQNFSTSDLYGIHRTARVAIVDDNVANVNNFSGLSSKHEADDGSAYVDMFTVFLENKSLQDLSTGFTKKTLAWDFDSRYHTGGLMKFATFPLSNEVMRNSQNKGGQNLYNLFRKMTDFKFDENLDITTSFNGNKIDIYDLTEGETIYKEIPFTKAEIIESERRGNTDIVGRYAIMNNQKTDNIIYKSDPVVFSNAQAESIGQGFENVAIIDFESIGNNTYLLHLDPVDETGSPIVPERKAVYKEEVKIESLYDLHKAFGGLYSKQLKGGELQYSDLNFMLGANLMSLHGYKKEGTKPTDYLSQRNVIQPLKNPKYRISYITNSSGFKTGAQNVNPNSVFTNDAPLKYMNFNMDYTGIQSDTENYVSSDSSVTEPSQFTSLIASRGLTQEYTAKAYNAIAAITRSSLKDIKSIVDNVYDSTDSKYDEAKKQLYNLISSELIKALKVDDNTYGMQKGIINLIYENLDNLNNNIISKFDSLDFKLPGSDPAIYKKIVIDMTSKINSAAIKRKLKGLAATLTPSYEKLKLYRLNGKTYKFDDLRNRFRLGYVLNRLMDIHKTNPLSQNIISRVNELLTQDVNNNTKLEVDLVLDLLQEATQDFNNISRLKPETNIYLDADEVKSFISKNPNNSLFMSMIRDDNSVSIDSYEKYSFIKNNFTRFQNDITRPTNLRPLDVYWSLDDMTEMNIYDLDVIKNSFKYQSLRDNFNVELMKYENNPVSFDYIKNKYYDFYKSVKNLNIAGLDDIKIGNLTSVNNLLHITTNVKAITALVLKNNEIVTGALERGLIQISDYMDRVGFDYSNYEIVRENGFDFIKIDPSRIKKDSYEIVLPKMFAKEFGLKQNDSISDILDKGSSFFMNQFNNKTRIDNEDYSVGFSNVSGETLLIRVKDSVLNPLPLDYFKQKLGVEDIEVIGNDVFLKENSLKIGKKTDSGIVYFTEIFKNNKGQTIYEVNKEGFAELIPRFKNYDRVSLNPLTIMDSLDTLRLYLSDIINTDMEGKLLNRLSNILSLRNLSASEYISKLEYETSLDNKILADRKLASFKKSLECIVVRIPAQTMQSSMKMNVVAFTESDSTSAYVSRMQTWLQGSDYDIDTGWVITPDINKGGLYQGWSPYFNIDSIEALKASEYLPVPNGKNYTVSENGLDISEFANYINSVYDKKGIKSNPDYIKYLAEWLTKIDNYDSVYAKDVSIDKALNIINNHNNYLEYNNVKGIGINNINRALRNAISSSLMQIISDSRNLIQSTIPINMDDPSRAAAKSPLGAKASRSNFNIPSGMIDNQTQNMVGQEVIGIAATAEKIFFASTFYYNEAIRTNNQEVIGRLPFYKRLKSLGQSPRTMLANVNYDIASESFKLLDEAINHQININNTNKDGKLIISEAISDVYKQMAYRVGEDQALIISAMLSAATDNAKELILAKINAGPDTVGMYLYASMLGYDFETVAGFMSHDVVQTLMDTYKVNSFENGFNNFTLDNIFSLIEGGPKIADQIKVLTTKNDQKISVASSELRGNLRKLFKYLSGQADDNNHFKLYRGKYKDVTLDRILLNEIFPNIFQTYESTKGRTLKSTKKLLSNESFIALSRYKELFNKYVELAKWVKSDNPISNDLATSKSRPHLSQPNKQIYEDFVSLFRSSKDTIFFGSLLGINQGMKTRVEERLALINNINDHFNSKIEDYAIDDSPSLVNYLLNSNYGLSEEKANQYKNTISKTGMIGNFDFIEFINPYNTEYSDAAIALYNVVKDSINIFDVIDKVPHYKAMYEALWYTDYKDSNSLFKYKSTKTLLDYMKTHLDSKIRFDASSISKLESFIDDIIIKNWLDNKNIEYTVKKSERYLNESYEEVEALNDIKFNLNTQHGRDNFKYYIERVVYPKLKNNPDLSNYDNSFINALKYDYKRDPITGYQVKYLNMAIDITNQLDTQSIALTEKYSKSLRSMNQTINGIKIHDLFFLYNLLINKNRAGKNTLTNLFSEFNLDKDGIVYDYMKYVSDLDSGDIVIPSIKSFKDSLNGIAMLAVRSAITDKNDVISTNQNNGNIVLIYRDIDSDTGLYTYNSKEINNMVNYLNGKMYNYNNYNNYSIFRLLDSYDNATKIDIENRVEKENIIEINKELKNKPSENVIESDTIVYDNYTEREIREIIIKQAMDNKLNITYDC